jgi:hypothetical protein
MIRLGWCIDIIMVEQLATDPGVLTQNQLHFRQNGKGATGDIGQIAYGRWNDIKCGWLNLQSLVFSGLIYVED